MSTSPQTKRGELRIYLGAAPGVGKTYAMLGEAHRRLERGTDVVAAVVESHGRRKTGELLDGIEVIPPRYIDYRGGRFALVVLTNTARSLPWEDFAPVTGWLNGGGFSSQEVSLSLPRFTLQASEELLEPLKALGLKHGMDSVTAFENLTMLPQEISRIVQKTFMKVDEEGTEAAAATGVVMETTALKRHEPERLVVDRPFLFALRDRESGLILMSGYIAKPSTGPAASLGAPKQFASETPTSPHK